MSFYRGTSFNHGPLEIALRDVLGANGVYVDVAHQSGTENGQVLPALAP